jgi:hypothetical protein
VVEERAKRASRNHPEWIRRRSPVVEERAPAVIPGG